MLRAMAMRDCPNCGAQIPADNRFCGSCGSKIDIAAAPAGGGGGPAKTMFFGASQPAGKAKLTVIKGEGMDGVTYVLSSSEHIAGRLEGAILFPEDPLLSPRHANFVYKDGKLIVRDEGSANGVFVRIIRPQTVDSGS